MTRINTEKENEKREREGEGEGARGSIKSSALSRGRFARLCSRFPIDAQISTRIDARSPRDGLRGGGGGKRPHRRMIPRGAYRAAEIIGDTKYSTGL